MPHSVKTPKKLIEVALPLELINSAAKSEKGNPFLKGHPRNLHQWWARRPQAVARAVIFGQMVNDPSWKWELERPEQIPPNNLKASWAASRKRLFGLIAELAKWENSEDRELLRKAREEIWRSWQETCSLNQSHREAAQLFNPNVLPAFHDPFSGGGALPLEAQRLGLRSYATDLNPVAVLINKLLIELPSYFCDRPPVNPARRHNAPLIKHSWSGSRGLADDIRYYSKRMEADLRSRISHLYPRAEVSSDPHAEALRFPGGTSIPLVAWLWARTVKSPNPAFRHVEVPLVSTFVLANKEGKETYVQPVVTGDSYSFTIKSGEVPAEAKTGTKLRGAQFRCLLSGSAIAPDYIRAEANAGRLGVRLMALVGEGPRGRLYLAPTADQEATALAVRSTWKPEVEFFQDALGFRVGNYAMRTWGDLYSTRQAAALAVQYELLPELRKEIYEHALAAGFPDDAQPLSNGGRGALAYSEALVAYLAMAVDKFADYNNMLCTWNPTNQNVRHLFTKQTISMAWDFSEASPIEGGLSPGNLAEGIAKSVEALPAIPTATALMHNAANPFSAVRGTVISTDPPYFDNVGYADLSDFFYVWLRPALQGSFPDLFGTISTPKAEELVATPARHGGRAAAERFFLEGMGTALRSLREEAHPAFPITIYYAFKQSETDEDAGTASSGWEVFLEAVIGSGFAICGTWPFQTEREVRSRGLGSNALSTSVVMVCRPRSLSSGTVSRRAFLRELDQVLPEALDEMTKGTGDDRSPVAPVDLSQAIIGPGMAVFSKYVAVLEADGTPMSVRTALQLINRFLAEDDFDHDTQFCLHWFEQYGWKEGKFGDADTLARAKGTSVDGVKQSGVLYAAGGVVRLLKWPEFPTDWDPQADQRLPVWEALHQLIRIFKTDGESGAGRMLAGVQNKAEATRQLAYRLYTLCERAGWAEDARAYNEIVTSWSAIEAAAAAAPALQQASLFE